MRGDVDMVHVALTDQFGVDFLLLGHFEIIGDRHDDHPGLESFVLFIGDKGLILGFVRVSYDHLIRADERKPARFKIPFLR
ncbi:hypothetical protein D1872_235040 [compost metagenome]